MKNKSVPLPKIVSAKDIPKGVVVPTDNLINVFRVCTQLEKICTDNDGIGLSAVQVGIPWNLFVVMHSDHYKYLVNCDYKGSGEKKKSIEGCLSLRDGDGNLRRFEVERASTILLTGKELVVSESGLEVKDMSILLDGLYAIVYAHEIDHQKGILISDIGREIELF